MSESGHQAPPFNSIRELDLELSYLRRKFQTAHQWLPALPLVKPDVTPQQALQGLRERIRELRQKRREHRRAHPPGGPRGRGIDRPRVRKRLVYREPLSRGSAASSAEAHRLRFDRGDLAIAADSWSSGLLRQAGEANHVEGVARASGFRRYTIHGSDLDFLFLPYRANDPTSTEDYAGATGFQFDGAIEADPVPIFPDPIEWSAVLALLQYTLPETPWEGVLSWNVTQTVESPRVHGEGDHVGVGISSVVRPRPAGEDFPAPADMWDFFFMDQVPLGGALNLEGQEVDGTVLVQESFSNSYAYVFTKGQRPRIYLGVALDLSACDGSCSFDDPSLVYHSAGRREGLAFRFDRS